MPYRNLSVIISIKIIKMSYNRNYRPFERPEFNRFIKTKKNKLRNILSKNPLEISSGKKLTQEEITDALRLSIILNLMP